MIGARIVPTSEQELHGPSRPMAHLSFQPDLRSRVTALNNHFDRSAVTAVVAADLTVRSIELLGTTGPMTLTVAAAATLTATNGLTLGPGATLKANGTIIGDIINSGGTVTAGLPEPNCCLLFVVGVIVVVWVENRKCRR